MPGRARGRWCRAVAWALLPLAPAAALAEIPTPVEIPRGVPDPPRSTLLARRTDLAARHRVLKDRAGAFNRRCAGVEVTVGSTLDAECTTEQNDLLQAIRDYTAATKRFAGAVADAGRTSAELTTLLNDLSASFRKEGFVEGGLPKGKRPRTPGADGTLRPDPAVSLNCKHFFLQLGKRLGEAGWSASEFTTPAGRPLMANDIADQLESCAARRCGRWEKVTPERAQELANQGRVVIGAQADRTSAGSHGHLAVVEPLPPEFDPRRLDPPADPPFVRDGNQHDWRLREKGGQAKSFPSTWGAVPAKRAFTSNADQPVRAGRYLWNP